MQDHYKTLGIKQDAPQSEVHKAFRDLAQKYHPDRNPSADAQQKFASINEAYQTLKDPAKRRHYDAERQLSHRQAKAEADYKPPEYYQPSASAKRRSSGVPDWLKPVFSSLQLVLTGVIGAGVAIGLMLLYRSLEYGDAGSPLAVIQAAVFGFLGGLVLPAENRLLLQLKAKLKDGYHLLRAVAASLSGIFFGGVLAYLAWFQFALPFEPTILIGMLIGQLLFGWVAAEEAFWAKLRLPKAYFEMLFVLVRLLGIAVVMAGFAYLVGTLLAGYNIITQPVEAAFFGAMVGILFGSVSPSDLRAYARYASAYAGRWLVWLIVALALLAGFIAGVLASDWVWLQVGG